MAQQVSYITTPEEWEQLVVKSEKPVLVDFFANWCGPCQLLKPQLEEEAQAANGKWRLVCVNIDEEKIEQLAQQYASEIIPSVYLFNKGQQLGHFMGNNFKKAQVLIQQALELQ